jgi:hypothetical protein
MTKHESYVSLATASLLKEIGFDWDCEYAYFNNQPTLSNEEYDACNLNEEDLLKSAPTLAVAQRWLREVKGIEVIVKWHVILSNGKIASFENREYEYSIQGVINMANFAYSEGNFLTYEYALEEGIRKCLALLLGYYDE